VTNDFDATKSAVTSSLLRNGARLSHYVIQSFLGSGGMGQVYTALDERLERTIAIKLLPASLNNDPNRVRRFIQEAKAASALNHPNIVTIHESDECDLGPFIVMELIRGETLRERIRKRLPLEEVIDIGTQIARALTAAHFAGIVHRDIKPDNIMVREDGYVKVLDFGLARLTEGLSGDESTVTGGIMGTLRYMSPEQGRSQAIGVPSDVFSLGLVFYEMATGRHPFEAASPLATFQAIAEQPAASTLLLDPEVPRSLDELILSMLEKPAAARPGADQIVATLIEIRMGTRTATVKSSSRSKLHKIVGRERELEQLRSALASSRAGSGMLICVSGEAGLGKSTLIETFLEQVSAEDEPCLIGRGRCSDRATAGEAYLPVLGALDTLLSSDQSGWVARTMRLVAPHWYMRAAPTQIVDESSLSRESLGEGSAEQMKRELAALFQTLSKERKLVVFFDDLQWADDATVAATSYLATQFDQLSLLLISTYRESELLLAKHPFLDVKLNLQARNLCREIGLGFLSEPDVRRYLAEEFPENAFPKDFAGKIHSRTEGHPLFVADLVRYLKDQRAIIEEKGVASLGPRFPETEKELPESVRSMIQRKMEQVDESDRSLLVAASVQGYEFDSAVVAQVSGMEPLDVEERLERLERVHRFVQLTEERDMPDGTLSCRYQFIHILYQGAFYATLRPTRRAALSGTTARAMLGFYASRKSDIASMVAPLLATSRDFTGAAQCYMLAAQNAESLFAHKEAAAMARGGLGALKTLPAGQERTRLELPLQLALGRCLAFTGGYTQTEAIACFSRASHLAQEMGDEIEWFPAVFGLWMISTVTGDCRKTIELAQQQMRMAENANDAMLLTVARHAMAQTLELSGNLEEARKYAEQILSTEASRDWVFTSRFLIDPVYGARMIRLRSLWFFGHPEAAIRETQQALARSREERMDPRTLCALSIVACMVYQFCGSPEQVRTLADEAIAICSKHEFPMELQWLIFKRGWAVFLQENANLGITQMRSSLEFMYGAGALMFVGTYYVAVLTEALIQTNNTAEASQWIERGLDFVGRSGHHFFESELHRLQGEVQRQMGAGPEAEESFRKALDIAREQHSQSLQLRAATSLSRFLQQQGRQSEAVEILSTVYGSFTEGFDTVDLKEAAALL
jgi:serine/threonine protein kinase/tetratricopeptide (TPR) repeat protein